jgi:mono/diheme cytochrome c family protein
MCARSVVDAALFAAGRSGKGRRTTPWPALAFAAAAFGLSAGAEDAATIEHGRQVFQLWCAPCHAPGPRHPGTQALEALYKGAKPGALEQRTDLVPTLTQTFVRSGVSVMPPFRKTEIGDADLAALAAYLAPGVRR